MNLPFCLWLSSRRSDSVWVMFHEYAYQLRWGLTLPHTVLGCVTPAMAALVAARADKVFVSTTTWEPLIPRSIRRSKPIIWLPVPSNLPLSPSENRILRKRAETDAGKNSIVIGHFGTYGPVVAPLVLEVLPLLLSASPTRHGLLMGRNSREFLAQVTDRHPDLRSRIVATGALPSADLPARFRECDVMLQPYPDGVTTRRGSFMAGLSLGLPVITNAGESTEPIWFEEDAFILAKDSSPVSIVSAAEDFLSAPGRWNEVRSKATDLYHRRFSLARSLDIIRDAANREEAE